jgi:hypothetical protein
MTALQWVAVGVASGAAVLCGGLALSQPDRRRARMLVIAIVVALVYEGAVLIHNAIARPLPYLAELGVVIWGLIISVLLAFDFRAGERRLHAALTSAEQHADELVKTIESTLLIRDKLNTPLQTLELGLAMRSEDSADGEQTLAELRDAVRALADLGVAVAETAREHEQERAA